MSVNGGQAGNVDRRNDYTVGLLSPTLVLIDEVTVADTMAGTTSGRPRCRWRPLGSVPFFFDGGARRSPDPARRQRFSTRPSG